MFRRWRFQFGLKAFLLAALFLPPMIAYQYRHWRYERFWQGLEIAKQRRDTSLVAWRRTYDLVQTGKAAEAQEVAAQVQYFSARQDVESAFQVLKQRYGSEDALNREMQARQNRHK
jgi:hypothetical protein